MCSTSRSTCVKAKSDRARALVFASLLVCAAASANEQEIQRALILRDQQSAEFAAGVASPGLEALHSRQRLEAGQPLHPDPALARELQPYERQRMAREREHVLRLPPPVVQRREAPPPPLPGLPRPLVEPVAVPQGG